MDSIAYKIEERATLDAAVVAGAYEGSPLDRTDGFIHLSAKDQVRETLAKWFAGRTGLALAAVDLTALGDTVTWEPSRGGALFPHVYGAIPAAAITSIVDLGDGEEGADRLPPGFDAPAA